MDCTSKPFTEEQHDYTVSNRIFREEYWKAAEVVLGSAVVAIWRNGGSNGAAC